MEIASIDHFVLTVHSITETCAFYERVLGMKAAEFGQGRWSLSFGRQKINLHQVGKEFEPRARTAQPGTGDFCLISGEPLEAVVRHLEKEGVAIEIGPVPKTGADGPITSVYIRDPDDNLVEISEYQVAR